MATLAGPEQQPLSLEGVHTLLRGLWGQFDAFMLFMEAGPRLPVFTFVLCDLGQSTLPLCALVSPSIQMGQIMVRTSKACCD